MTATNHSANQGRVPAQGVPAQQMPTTAPAAAVLGAAPCPQPPATLEPAEAATSSPIPVAPEIALAAQLEAMFKALISY